MRARIFAVVLLFSALIAACGTNGAAQTGQKTGNADLESVLSRMDASAAAMRTVSAKFEWVQYQKVIEDIVEVQKGTIYFRKQPNHGTEMAADITDPSKKVVLFTEGKVQLYEPSVDRVTRYSAGKNREAIESFLVLGFGGRGHDLPKNFDVKYAGNENVGGINTSKLELTPKQPKVRNMFGKIWLWIDPQRGISIQQKFLNENGDYRLAKYSNIKVNGKVADSAFKIKTTAKTEYLDQ